jgi:prolyl oligopeptidase PreP (S9A serine peptidase family)
MGAYYSSNVFINEIQKEDRTITDPDTGVVTTGTDYKKTNRVIVSHFVNMDTKDRRENARDFSAQRQKLRNNETQSYDETEIPYKIVCPTTVNGIV